MPEGPELHLASRFVNELGNNTVFSGKIEKSTVHKCPPVVWDVGSYKIRAESRGKEIKLHLDECPNDSVSVEKCRKMSILFRFGMSGCFQFTSLNDLPKHSHLRFFTKVDHGKVPMVLSFVDFRRFGRWEVDADWGKERGPCPISEYQEFRRNVVDNLDSPAFVNKPICEVLLNQQYFNGIGNYLRAEILYRAKILPFEEAKNALLQWKDAPFTPIENGTICSSDPLYLCHKVSCEVLKLSKGYDVEHNPEAEQAFHNWLQCYQKPGMNNLVDSHKRTIWFHGEPGHLVPRGAISRKVTPVKSRVNETILSELKSEKKIKLEKQSIVGTEITQRVTRSSRRAIFN